MLNKLLIFHDFFLPGNKGGGPVQSLKNLVAAIIHQTEIYVITSAYDLNDTKPYENIKLNGWNKISIENKEVHIWYADKTIIYSDYLKNIKALQPNCVFFNCIYSVNFFILPLLFKRWLFNKETKLIISPRGVLQEGSLAIKAFKKNLFLLILKSSSLLRNCNWHASSTEEEIAIQKRFGKKNTITVLGNTPKKPFEKETASLKKNGTLRLIHLSLIAPIKNIHTLLQSLLACKEVITVDIYGAIKDEEYWLSCQAILKELPLNVNVYYKGDLENNKVQQTIAEYDALILLTKGENFGHVLFESLSVGRPIITSYFTPWNNLEKIGIGWNVNIDTKTSITTLLEELCCKTNTDWNEYCNNALRYAQNYYDKLNTLDLYSKMFFK